MTEPGRPPIERSTVTRRRFLKLSGAGVAGGSLLTMLDARQAPAADYAVVVFPEDRDLWTAYSRHIAAGRADLSGRFKVTGLPPGRYLAAAIDALEVGEERDPQFLRRLAESRAERLTLTEGESKTLHLTVTTIP